MLQPYNSTVVLSNGTTITAATRERPKVYLDPASGELQWLFTGTVAVGSCPDAPHTRNACANCKYHWPTYWLAQPLGSPP